MGAVPFSALPPNQALQLLHYQKLYSPEQREMAINSPHMVWVRPKSRGLSKRMRQAVWDRGDGACTYCKATLTVEVFTIDHIHPVSMGGSDCIDNLTVACRSCNSAKGGRLVGGADE